MIKIIQNIEFTKVRYSKVDKNYTKYGIDKVEISMTTLNHL